MTSTTVAVWRRLSAGRQLCNKSGGRVGVGPAGVIVAVGGGLVGMGVREGVGVGWGGVGVEVDIGIDVTVGETIGSVAVGVEVQAEITRRTSKRKTIAFMRLL